MEILQSTLHPQQSHERAASLACPGDLVRARDAIWRVTGIRARTPVRIVRLVGADAHNRWQPCTLLEPFDRVRPVTATRATPRVVSRSRWMRTLAALLASAAPPGCPASVASTQVTLMPHQIVPLLAVLGGRASRLLLADAVGLGKTIQAALLIRELRARGCADRVLVLVPPGLRDQWQQELAHRTGLAAVIVDAGTLAARVRELPPDVNPWTLAGLTIASLDFVKQPGVRRGIDAITWDALIVDEAHGLTDGTDRGAIVDTLARHSRLVVLLTATPHHGSDEAFAALCRLGAVDARTRDRPHADDPIAIIRRTRSAVGLPMSRRIHVLRVTRTNEERWMDTLLMRYARRVQADQDQQHAGDSARVSLDGPAPGDAPDSSTLGCVGDDGRDSRPGDGRGDGSATGASLALSVLIKRGSSSAASLERSLRRRLALLEAAAPSPPESWLPESSLPESSAPESSLPESPPASLHAVSSLTAPSIEASSIGASSIEASSIVASPIAACSPSASSSTWRNPVSSSRSSTGCADGNAIGGSAAARSSARVDGAPRAGPRAVQAALPFDLVSPASNDSPDRSAPASVEAGDERDDPADREPDDDLLAAPGLRNARLERAWLKLLIAAAHNAARAESKPRALVRWLRRTRESALIYTEYRDTLEQLARALDLAPLTPRSDWSHCVLHGGLDAGARRAALSRFASGEARLLLTTDAAGEGLNLQHRCRLVLNVELPWNPNRLEQRIGRVDRLGQTRTVHAVHLVAAGSAEEQMLERLTGRVRRIAATLGDAPVVLNARPTAPAPPLLPSLPRMPAYPSADGALTSLVSWPCATSHALHASHTSHVSSVSSVLPVLHERHGSRAVSTPADHHLLASQGAPLSPRSSGLDALPAPSSRSGGSDPGLIWIDDIAEATSVVAQLRVIRTAQARAWRARRPRTANRACGSARHARGDPDPLMALEARTPLVAVACRHTRTRERLRLPSSGLLCVWRTRVSGDSGDSGDHERQRPPLLTAAFVACGIACGRGHRAIAAFVGATMERCRGGIEAVLDREQERVLAGIRDDERAWRERRACRNAAIDAALRTHTRGPLQPWLFANVPAVGDGDWLERSAQRARRTPRSAPGGSPEIDFHRTDLGRTHLTHANLACTKGDCVDGDGADSKADSKSKYGESDRADGDRADIVRGNVVRGNVVRGNVSRAVAPDEAARPRGPAGDRALALVLVVR